MSHQPFQTLHVKYNSTRRPEFRITTQICQDANERFVLKRADGKMAGKHLDDIRLNGMAIQDYYANNIKVISSEPTERGLCFPFIKGQTLADQVSLPVFDRETILCISH